MTLTQLSPTELNKILNAVNHYVGFMGRQVAE